MPNSRLVKITIVLTIAAVIGICLFLCNYRNNESLSLQPNELDPSNATHQLITAMDNKSNVASVAMPSSQTVESPTNQEKDINPDLRIRVVDALGDLISDATLAVAGKIYNSTNSEFVIHDLKSGTVQALASAKGWEPKEIAVDMSANTDIDITLEYLCSFEIMITDNANNNAPLEGMEVILWQGPQIIRPVQETVTLKTKDVTSYLGDMGTIALNRASGNLNVFQSLNYGSGRQIYSQEMKNPAVGDILIALSGSCWRPGSQSAFSTPYTDKGYVIHRRIRIWDSLALFDNYGGTQVFGGSLDFERNGVQYKNELYEISRDIKGEVAARGITDKTGKCRFENLPPRLYFVQGREQNRRTDIRMLTPIEKGKRLYMQALGKQSMTVEVVKAGELFISNRGIENALVQLTGQEHHYQGMTQTNRSGLVGFQKIPFDTYALTITPPDILKSIPESKTIKFEFEEYYKYLHVEFAVNTGHQVSGVVLDKDTSEPVSGFSMQLHYFKNDAYITTGYVTSGNGGVFQLPNLDAGHYVLSGDVDRKSRKDYLPVPTESLYRNMPGLHFEVNDQDIEGLIFYVLPTVLTRFIGNIVDEEGRGISGAHVTLSEGIPVEEVQSGENGHFELPMLVRKDSNQQEAKVVACVAQEQEPIITATTSTQASVTSSLTSFGPLRIRGKITGQGTCPVQYKAGETVEGILVKIATLGEHGRRIVGHIKNKEGEFPACLDGFNLVQGKQNERTIRGEVDEDGKYALMGINPGPLVILVSPMKKRVYSEGGSLEVNSISGNSYRPLTIHTQVPDEPELTALDIKLEPGLQINGRVIDEHSQPVSKCYITAKAEDFTSACWADSLGNFILDDLLPEARYEIAVSLSPSEESLKKILITTPSEGIVVIKVKRDK